MVYFSNLVSNQTSTYLPVKCLTDSTVSSTWLLQPHRRLVRLLSASTQRVKRQQKMQLARCSYLMSSSVNTRLHVSSIRGSTGWALTLPPTALTASDTPSSRPGARRSSGLFIHSIEARLWQLNCRRLPKSTITPLQRVHNAEARLILNVKMNDYVKPVLRQRQCHGCRSTVEWTSNCAPECTRLQRMVLFELPTAHAVLEPTR